MTEVWFDTTNGALGEYKDNTNSLDTISLGELLTADNFPFTINDYEKVDISKWSNKDFIKLGHLALENIQPKDQAERLVPLTKEHLRRLYLLGLGPEKHTYARQKRFSSIADFQVAIGSPINKPNGYYDTWSLPDFITYASELAEKLGRKPLDKDYDEAAKHDPLGNNPNYQIIQDHVGGVGKLHEYLGYPNVRDWLDDDFIDWGIKVMEANPDTAFTCTVPDILSKRGRGPSTKTIINHFGSWRKYNQQVRDESITTQQSKAKEHEQRLMVYQEIIESGELPQKTINLPINTLHGYISNYLLINACLPNLPLEKKQAMANTKTSTLISAIQRVNPQLSAGYIETEALTIGVFDDIWPSDNHLEYLKI